MKAAVLTGIRQLEITEVPKPAIEKDTDVLLRIEKIGVCGSDVHYYQTGRIGSQVVQYPYLVGHECSAVVEAVGGGVKNVARGNQVVVDPAVSCHDCDQCRMGRDNTCRNLRFLGTPGQGDGCLCEYIVMPEVNCFPTKGTVNPDQAVICEPLAIGIYSVARSGSTSGAKIAILGSGPIGLSCMIASLTQRPQSLYMTDKIQARMDAAKQAGADWVGNPEQEDITKAILEREPLGLDVVYECAGEQETLDEAIELLRPGGKLMLVGIPEIERVSFIIDKIRRKEITIINVRRQKGCTQKAIDLIAGGKGAANFMITHHFPLDETKEAFDLVSGYRDGVIKAIIDL